LVKRKSPQEIFKKREIEFRGAPRSGSQDNQVCIISSWLKGDGGKDRISDQSSFEKIKIGSLGLFIFTKLNTQSLYSVSIVKRWHLLLIIFGFQHKNEKIQKYIFGRNPKK
jgi:hypothetical protein